MVIDRSNRDATGHLLSKNWTHEYEKADRLLKTEIGFVDNETFRTTDHWQTVQQSLELVCQRSTIVHTNVGDVQGSSINRICQLALLTRNQEFNLFLSMNFLKYRANSYRSKIDLRDLDIEVVRNAERFLKLSRQIRDHLIQSNIRLAVSIVKSFLKPSLDFDDLLSDGIDALFRASQKFDYDRGFRFSTYATMVIRRHIGRQLQLEAKRKKRFDISTSSYLDALEDRETDRKLEAMTSKEISLVLLTMLNTLDDRERYIVNERFGFGAVRKKRTLTSLAIELGICKERVRQLEQRALKKLRQMASENLLGEMDSEISA